MIFCLRNLYIFSQSGCDRGFGNELAKRLLQKGYTVFAGCMATDCEGATALKALSRTRMHLVPLDITKDDQTELALKYVEENLGNKGKWIHLRKLNHSKIEFILEH